MKTKEEIQERLNKLEKELSLINKHHEKYVKLFHKACNSWGCKDFTGSRMRRYKSKYIDLAYTWREMLYYGMGLQWVLEEEQIND